MPTWDFTDINASYRIRLAACLATSIVTILLVVHQWPLHTDTSAPVLHVSENETIRIDEIQPTRHTGSPPAPPPPLLPVVVPNDELNEEVLDLSDGLLAVDDQGDDGASDPENTRSARSNQAVSPKAIRFVEPKYTKKAQSKRVRAAIVVRVLVDERGRVSEAEITERYLLSKVAAKEPVTTLGNGLDEAALTAAKQWIFRPGYQDGEPIAAYMELNFTFGTSQR